MKLGSSLALVLSGALALLSSPANAWNDMGHMMVAAVAWDQMEPAVQARAIELLKLNPDYKKWIKGASADTKDKIAFVHAATWPDAIKSRGKLKGKLKFTDDGEVPKGAKASANIGYKDKLMHKYWHYKDVPFSPDGTKLVQPQAPNAETQINAFSKAIASGANASIKSYDVTWLIHIVGDVHQPLHATSRFTKLFKKGDRGGNDVKMTCCARELHAFWDDLMGNSKKPADAIAAAQGLAKAPDAAAAQSDPAAWINESFEIAKDKAYASVGTTKAPFTPDQTYQDTAKSIGSDRIALAGARLARLFNASLK